MKLSKYTFHFCEGTLCKVKQKSGKAPRETVVTDFQPSIKSAPRVSLNFCVILHITHVSKYRLK